MAIVQVPPKIQRENKARKEYEDNLRFNPSRYIPRCKDCNGYLDVFEIRQGICNHCQNKRNTKSEKRTRYKQSGPEVGLIAVLKRRLTAALKREGDAKFHFNNLTMDYLIKLYDAQKGKCALSGRDLSLGSRELNRHDENTLSLDRINPSLGYIQGNVQLVTWQVNVAKGRHSDSEFLSLCRDIVTEFDRKSEKADKK